MTSSRRGIDPARVGRGRDGLVRNRQGLAGHLEDLLEGKHRGILRAADQCGIVDSEQARGVILAEPVGLAQRRAGGQLLGRLRLDASLACNSIGSPVSRRLAG